jgi:predicted metal-dependent hydrolase
MASSIIETVAMSGFVAIIKRTSRKGSVGFKLSSGRVVVLAPKAISKAELRLLLASRSAWILDKLKVQGKVKPHVERLYVSDERLVFLDRELILKVSQGAFSTGLKGESSLVVSVPEAKPDWVRNALVRWYKLQAQVHMEQRVNYFAPLVGAWPKSIEIKTYRARWGSCNSSGQVQFNWKLMMAPSEVVDSVVVHELCHLLYMHHGPEFWVQVKRVLPNYQDAKQWLKDEGYGLGLD